MHVAFIPEDPHNLKTTARIYACLITSQIIHTVLVLLHNDMTTSTLLLLSFGLRLLSKHTEIKETILNAAFFTISFDLSKTNCKFLLNIVKLL